MAEVQASLGAGEGHQAPPLEGEEHASWDMMLRVLLEYGHVSTEEGPWMMVLTEHDWVPVDMSLAHRGRQV